MAMLRSEIVRDKKGCFVQGQYVGFGFKKGHPAWNKGSHMPVEIRRKNSEAHIKTSPITSFTQKERDIIVGSLLGDGSIRKTATRFYDSCYFREGHALEQEEYLTYKAEVLNRFNSRLRLYKNKGYLSRHLETSVHPLFTQLYRSWYPNGHKVFLEKNVQGMSKFGLA
ncbi:unnamed protein product, partial [marine sediment metagenome]